MTTSSLFASAPAAPSASAESIPRVIEPAARRAVLAHALMAGIAGDMLVRDVQPGVGMALWFAIAALILVSILWRAGRTVATESSAWLATAVVFAAALAWRNAEELQLLNLVAAAAAFVLAAASASDDDNRLLSMRLRDAIRAAARIARRTAAGIAPLVPPALRELVARQHTASETGGAGLRAGVRASVIVGVMLVVFGSLLRSADPIFASLVALPDLDIGTALSHVAFAALITWIVGGWILGALGHARRDVAASDWQPVSLGALEVNAALGTLNVMFAAFVIAQLGWFFGGERFLLERTGLTAAQYARQGFFQMVCVVALVVPLLLSTRAALAPGRALARRHTMLALPLLTLLGVMIVSAVLRLRLYVSYFGLTTDRFYPLVFMGWLTLVLVMLAATVLRGRGRPFVAGAVLSAFATLAVLNAISPDRVVARVNVERAGLASPALPSTVDLAYLARLGGDAADIAIGAVLASPRPAGAAASDTTQHAQRCAAARTLLGTWGPGSRRVIALEESGSWRIRNLADDRAIADVGRAAGRLRAVMHESCRSAAAARRATVAAR